MFGLRFELRDIGQPEPPRLTVYQDIGRTMPGANSDLGSLSASHADFSVSSKGRQNAITLAILYKLMILQLLPVRLFADVLTAPRHNGKVSYQRSCLF